MRRSKALRELPLPDFGQVWLHSAAEGLMSGEVFLPDEGGNCGLFRHFCGFGFILGEPGEGFLEDVRRLMVSGNKRLVLFSKDERTAALFRQCPEIKAGKRLFFRYEGGVPEHCPELCAIDRASLPELSGRVVPGVFWDSPERFLEQGAGFMAKIGGKAAGWAFSAAVSRDELDIGVETAPGFQRKGLALRTAGEMIRYAIETGRRPVWACAESNEGSRKTAVKLGFVQDNWCYTFQMNK